MLLIFLLLLVGLSVLIFGAEILVRGSASLSKKAKIPSLVIGLTVVAFGTSAPELIVNILATLNGSTDIAIGNIVGSNIANILLILGVSALIVNLKVQSSTVWKEIPFAVLAVLMLLIMSNDQFLDQTQFNSLTRTDGLALIGFFIIFFYYIFALAKKGNNNEEESEIKVYSYFISIVLTLAGLVCLFFGGQMLVNQSILIAQKAGLSEIFIGLTIVAIGTSLPELVTSLVAAQKKQTDLAVGNIIGSNIFNIFWILGITSLIKPLPVSLNANIDIMICLSITLILFFTMFIGKKHHLEKWQGVLFLIAYLVYMVYLILRG